MHLFANRSIDPVIEARSYRDGPFNQVGFHLINGYEFFKKGGIKRPWHIKGKLRNIRLHDVYRKRSEATYDLSFEHFARFVREGNM